LTYAKHIIMQFGKTVRKDKLPQQLAIDIMHRSVCNVMVGAVIYDYSGRLIGWGHNNSGPDGNGICAEKMAIRRANRSRLRGATIYIAGAWKCSGNYVVAKPCGSCYALLKKHGVSKVCNIRKDGTWEEWGIGD